MVGEKLMTNEINTFDGEILPQAGRVFQPANIFDSNRFAMLDRVAQVMARSTMIPKHLTHVKEGNNEVRLADDQIYGNCFMVANMASNWGMDPFAVAQATSLVHGRLCFEGKLVAAVLDALIRVKLHYQFGTWNAEKQETDLATEGAGELLAIRVSELGPDGKTPTHRHIDGYVGGWKTTGTNTPWSPQNYRRQLRYRGAREFARAYEPAVMLGVYTPDEFDDVIDTGRSNRAKPIGGNTDVNPLLPPQDASTGSPARATAATDATKSKDAAGTTESGAGEATEHTPQQAAERVGSDVFRNYSSALVRFSAVDTVEKAAKKFWTDCGGYPLHSDDRALVQELNGLHRARIEGKLSIEDLNAAAGERIAESYGEQL
jgi:hypothetical protein